MMTLETLTADSLQPHLGQHFDITVMAVTDPAQAPEKRKFALELTAIDALPHARAGLRAPFALTFLGSDDLFYLPQRTYRFVHAEIGALDLFVSPLGPDTATRRMRYEAVIA